MKSKTFYAIIVSLFVLFLLLFISFVIDISETETCDFFKNKYYIPLIELITTILLFVLILFYWSEIKIERLSIRERLKEKVLDHYYNKKKDDIKLLQGILNTFMKETKSSLRLIEKDDFSIKSKMTLPSNVNVAQINTKLDQIDQSLKCIQSNMRKTVKELKNLLEENNLKNMLGQLK